MLSAIRLVRPLLLAAAGLLILPLAPAAQSPRVWELPVPGGLSALRLGDCGAPAELVVRDGQGRPLRVVLADGAPRLEPLQPCRSSTPPREPGMLPDSAVSEGAGAVPRAWLAQPTDRYAHGILGDAEEAAELRVRLADGRVLTHALPERQVFEDLRVRRLHLPPQQAGDPAEQFLVVRSDVELGSALALYGVREGALVLLAQSGEFGRPHRWLNPIDVADFDGDGRLEVAAVLTPHIGGTLALYEWKNDRLVLEHQRYPFSNHTAGSRNLDLAAVLDWNGDGVPDLALPSGWMDAFRIVTFSGGAFRDLLNLPVKDPISHAVRAADLDGDGWPELVAGTRSGGLLILRR